MASSRATPVTPILNFLRPLQAFIRVEVLGGTLLLAAAVIAIVWANSPWTESYQWLWQRKITISLEQFALAGTLEFWINDLLMAFFFLLVAMEIKRELAQGELNSAKRAALPLFAATGGMIVPALIFAVINWGGKGAHGWGVPMATDIAFALGAMRLLGKRIPIGLFAFLAALAIIDDLGAILVIAIFYSESLSWVSLGYAAALVGVLGVMNVLGVRRAGLYLLVGAPLWLAVLSSGIHATLAGVAVGLLIPVRRRKIDAPMLDEAKGLLGVASDPSSSEEDRNAALTALEQRTKQAEAPVNALEHLINPYVSYLILPLFALANAGVVLLGTSPSLVFDATSLGVILGLFLGKPIGIVAFTLVAVRLGVAALPGGVTNRHVVGAGMLAGIGFTVALFISGLAYEHGSLLHTEAKLGILVGSTISGIVGLLFLRTVKPAAAE